MRHVLISFCLVVMSGAAPAADAPIHETMPIFPSEKKHNHSSCIVELANGDLFTVWYTGHGERNSDDVEIHGARLKKGEKAWGPRIALADTPGYPDCNPAIFAAPDGSVWMIWPTILDHRWEGALLKFVKANDHASLRDDPQWDREGVMHITPTGFEKAMEKAIADLKASGVDTKPYERQLDAALARSKELIYQRLGWMPRVHATVLPSGRWIWPLYCDTFSASIMAISDDKGKTWRASAPIIGFGAIQPSVVRKDDGTLVAFMRENGPTRRIRVSESKDQGETWSTVKSTDFPNPGAGVEATRLANGHWALIYNDLERGRNRLAVSISDDEGKTWKWTRHLEDYPPGGGSYHYPSIMQGSDGLIHTSYTYGARPEGSRIQYTKFNEAWIMEGDPKK
ncbi:MAG: sialidase family protein [Isosphaeraceae bacterium]|nr:sialidase family protein [Isosphaeraceae bacterium]